MGSFNVKCCLSGMEIVAGDPVVLLLGKIPGKKVYCGGYEGQGHKFQLLATPIFGSYNDYGWIERVEPQTWKAAMSCLDIMMGDEDSEDGDNTWKSLDSEKDSETFRDMFYQHSWDSEEEGGVKKDRTCMSWVHRTIWDSVVAGTDRKELSHHFTSMSGKGVFTPEDLEAFGKAIDVKVDFMTKYDNRDSYKDEEMHWFSIDGNTTQRFQVAQWFQDRIPGDPLAPKDLSEIKERYAYLRDSYPTEEAFNVVVSLMASIQSRSNDRSSQPIYYVVQTKLEWFFPFWGREQYGTSLEGVDQKVKGLLGLVAQYPQEFIQSAAMHEGITAGRMVIRPHGDMPTAAQGVEDSIEAAFQAMAKGILEVSQARIDEFEEDED